MPSLVKVKPQSKQQKILWDRDGNLLIPLKSHPVDGKASQELIRLLAHELGVSISQIQIRSGRGSRTKLIEVEDR